MTPTPSIAVVGASVRATAFSLLRAGCQVVAADLFADADLARACPATRIDDYPAALADWLANVECDGWLYTGGLENHPELVNRMAGLRPLLGNSAQVLHKVRDLLILQRALTEAGLPFPETVPCGGSRPTVGDWLHKTGLGASGSGVTHAARKPAGNSGYWQRRIDGVLGSAQFVGNDLHGITRQLVSEPWAGASEFAYCGTLAPWELSRVATNELQKIGALLADKFQLRGLYGVDFIFDGERPWTLEVNPRPTAAIEVVEQVTGRNLLAEHLADFGISAHGRPPSKVPAAGKVILYAKQPLVVSPPLAERLLAAAGSPMQPMLADIPVPDTEIDKGQPVLTLFASGASLAEVDTQLRRRVAELEGLLYGEQARNTS